MRSGCSPRTGLAPGEAIADALRVLDAWLDSFVGGNYAFKRLEAAPAGRPTPPDLGAFAGLQGRYAERRSASVAQQ